MAAQQPRLPACVWRSAQLGVECQRTSQLAPGAACMSRNRLRAGYLSMEDLEMEH